MWLITYCTTSCVISITITFSVCKGLLIFKFPKADSIKCNTLFNTIFFAEWHFQVSQCSRGTYLYLSPLFRLSGIIWPCSIIPTSSHLFYYLPLLVVRSFSVTLLPCMDREQTLRDIKVNASSPLSILNASKREKGKVKREDSLFTSKWMEADGDCYWKRLASLSESATQCMQCTRWNWLLSITKIWLWRNSVFSFRALICMAEVIWSYCGPPYHMDFISEHEAFQGNKKPQNPRQSGRDYIMLIWPPAGTFGSDLAPL